MVYKLCYINKNKAYFTSNFKKQWGDDWNDAPYEYNAKEPYDFYFENSERHKIEIKSIFFEFPYYVDIKRPCDELLNSVYSVEDINNHKCPWLTLRKDDNTNYIFAGTSYMSFIEQIEKFGGIIYTPRKHKKGE